MTIYDLSVPISSTLPVWPGDPSIEVRRIGKIEEGAVSNVSLLTIGTHTSTHVDPPYHFLPDGARVDELALERLIGLAWVVDCRGARAVTAELLESAAIPDGTRRLLLRTDNSELWSVSHHEFFRGFVDIAQSGAEWMVDRGVQVVGIDYASVDNIDDEGFVAHRALLPNGVIIIENLDLRAVPPDCAYELICLPLKISGGDGAPARVILREREA